jgi:hypothetical protein
MALALAIPVARTGLVLGPLSIAFLAQNVDLPNEQHTTALRAHLLGDVIETQDAVAILARTRPDSANLARRTEDILSFIVTSCHTGE